MEATKSWNATAYDQTFAFVSGHGVAVVDRLEAHAGERILDLGCGTGELTARIAATGAHVVGLDADPAMLERARQRFPQIPFVAGNAHSFAPPEGGGFDAVFSNAALHWMKTPEAVLACVARALKPGGRFVAEMGGAGNVAHLERAVVQARAAAGLPSLPSPWFFPSLAQYAGLLDRAGFEVLEMHIFDRPTPLQGDGAADWFRMFATPYLGDVSAQVASELLCAAAAIAEPQLKREGQVFADYRRLRFIARLSA